MDYLKDNWKNILLKVFISILLIGFISLIIYIYTPYKPENFSIQDLQKSNLDLDIKETPEYFELKPDNLINKSTGIIFYSGGRVDSTSYLSNAAFLARTTEVSVYVLKLTFNFAILDINAANKVLNNNLDLNEVYIGGHSLGGVAASSFATDNSGNPKIKGLFLWSSYPGDNKLKNSSIKVLSIYGSKDGLLSEKDINDSKSNLPPQTRYEKIEGLNHSQFGNYGLQDKDQKPDISNEAAIEKISSIMKDFIFKGNQIFSAK